MPTRRPRRRSRWLLKSAVLGLLLCLLLVGGAMAAYGYIGRTPTELIDYLKRRLEGHPTLEAVALPVLGFARVQLLGEVPPEAVLPFTVPPRGPNPLQLRPSEAAAGDPRVIRVGPQQPVSRISVAAQLATDGSIIEIEPGDYVADVAVWTQRDLTIRALGDRVRLVAAGNDAEGKAIWVFRGGSAVVEGVEFIGARAADRNGAGIRLESGRLVVRRCTFWGNQNGIMTASDADTELEVERSEFGYNGGGDGLTHALYIGAIGSFRLSASYLHHGNVGHLVKSRARHNRLEYNRITDEIGGRSSYEVEFPNGGVAELVGNLVQQAAGGRNSTMVSFGAEGYRWERNELRLVHNTIVNDQRFGGTLVRVWPGAAVAQSLNNLFVGPGRVEGAGVLNSAGDAHTEWDELVRPSREDYHVRPEAQARLRAAPQAGVAAALLPRYEYVHPQTLRPLSGPPTLPGALQAGS